MEWTKETFAVGSRSATDTFRLCSNEENIYWAAKRSTQWHLKPSFTIYKRAESCSPACDNRNHSSQGTGDCKATKCAADWIQGKERMDPEVHEVALLQFTTRNICISKASGRLQGEANSVPKVRYQETRRKRIPSGANCKCIPTSCVLWHAYRYTVNEKGAKQIKERAATNSCHK